MGVATQPLGENFVLVKVELSGKDMGAEFGIQGGEVGLIEVGEAAQSGLILGIISDAEHEAAANQGGGVGLGHQTGRRGGRADRIYSGKRQRYGRGRKV